jgi:hypothetical protein
MQRIGGCDASCKRRLTRQAELRARHIGTRSTGPRGTRRLRHPLRAYLDEPIFWTGYLRDELNKLDLVAADFQLGVSSPANRSPLAA